jgi:hypothetical protein
MVLGQHTGSGWLRRSLASLILFSVSLMSLAVDACETSCLLDGFGCGPMSSEASPPNNSAGSASFEMGSMVTGRGAASSSSKVTSLASKPCDGAEFCKDATTSVMRPAARIGIQKTSQTVISAASTLKWSNLEYLSNKIESPPPESPPLSPLSINLRI